ncbi:MAG: hypothetical protein LQ343_003114 [Gyalolechia ehrenbergii]|nr:MAG: hypothetical protein LQ343_003114 [Gyalolechia ehrenbergii]
MFLSAAIFTHHARDPLAQPSANTSSPYIEPRLLMLKRSATDPDGYANHWEMPAGPCQSTDQSVLHGLARAAWLQTKLNIFFIARQIGKGNTFSSEYKVNPEIPGDENWYKPCFEVYCSEVQKLLTNQAFRTKAGFEEMVNKIPVRLQADLHQSWSWMTKEEAQLMLDGKVPGEQFVNTVQGRRAIRAFEIRLDQAMQLDPEGSQGRKRLRGNDTDTKSKGGWSLEKA